MAGVDRRTLLLGSAAAMLARHAAAGELDAALPAGTREEAVLELGQDLGRFAFRPWSFTVGAAPKGMLGVLARATGAGGATQPSKPIPNPAGYHHNAIASLTVQAA